MISTLTVRSEQEGGISNIEYSENVNIQLVDRFTEFLDVSEITVKAYRSGIKQFMMYLNMQNVAMPNRESVVMFKKALVAEGRKPSTVALYLAAIRRFSSWLESEGLCADFAQGVHVLRRLSAAFGNENCILRNQPSQTAAVFGVNGKIL